MDRRFRVRLLGDLSLTGYTLADDELGGFTSHCPELGVASQGETEEEALAMLQEAVEGFLEVASDAEIKRRFE